MDKIIEADIARFHHHFYNGVEYKKKRGFFRKKKKEETFHKVSWMGVSTQKCPLDLWIYQELFFELRPDLVIETGTAAGGSALYMAHLCDLLNNGHIVTIDVETQPRREHERISYIHGSSSEPEVIQKAVSFVPEAQVVMVILDSDHTRDHVLKELELLSPLVSPGSYLIVEDTNINGHPVHPNFGPGPYEAVEEFMSKDVPFDIDFTREKFLLTMNPNGFLRRRLTP